MLGIHHYLLFVTTGILLNLTPGQDTFFILGRSIAEGTKNGVASALGISVGSLIHTVMAALGLSAVLATSAAAFTAVKLIGAAYLVYLGGRMLFSKTSPQLQMQTSGQAGANGAFRAGILTNVFNPKVALFFLAFMPQFIEPASTTKVQAFILLGLTFVATGTVWCLTLALAAGKLRNFFVRHPSGWQWLSRAVGGVFVFLGLRLATSRN